MSNPYDRVPVVGDYSLESINVYLNASGPVSNVPQVASQNGSSTSPSGQPVVPMTTTSSTLQSATASTQPIVSRPDAADVLPRFKGLTKWKADRPAPFTIAPRPEVEPLTDEEDDPDNGAEKATDKRKRDGQGEGVKGGATKKVKTESSRK